MMEFEFTVHPAFNFLTGFAGKLNTSVVKNRVIIPPSLGDGYVKKIDIEQDFKFVMHHYTLHQEFHLKRMPSLEKNDLISIIFNSLFWPIQTWYSVLNQALHSTRLIILPYMPRVYRLPDDGANPGTGIKYLNTEPEIRT